jgi:hypothetical protein
MPAAGDQTMKPYLMMIVFEGRGATIGSSTFVESRAAGRIIDVEGIFDAPCAHATFRSAVTATPIGLWESGRVSFDEINSHLDFTTALPGESVVREDKSSSGAIAWRITGGGGRFAGASGMVTGNFTGEADDTFVDYQVYKLFLPARQRREEQASPKQK